LSGFTILALLLFRLVWGFVGGREARFATFVRGPAAVWRYAAALRQGKAPSHLGHNPMGGWSILAMLASLGVQAATGLFANDDILTEGPLYAWVSKATSDGLTRIHRLNAELIVALVALHLTAVLFYFFFKRENLVKPMITGFKPWRRAIPDSAGGGNWSAAAVIALAAGAVYLLVR
jgi:cytochrome b